MPIPWQEIAEARQASRARWAKLTPRERREEFAQIDRPVPPDHPWLQPETEKKQPVRRRTKKK